VDELWLVCEGESESVDLAILRPVFADVLAAGIVVEPACGNSPNVVAQFLQRRRGGRAAYLNDRDYRPRADAEAALRDGRPGFLWRRHSIENYLLPPTLIVRGFRRLRERFEEQQRGHLPAWFAALPADPEQVADLLRECARLQAAEEASRLATYRLWAALPPSIGQIQKRNPPAPTTARPYSAEDWREALCQEAERVRQAATHTSVAPQLQRDAVAQWFDRAYAEVTAHDCLVGLECLIDFHGRDLLRAFHQRLASFGIRLSFDRLLDELIAAVIEEYRDNRSLYGSDDFRDLANGVRSLAGLDPVV
jgi:hypothetical protein